jgi:hypothetical protein
MTKVYKTLPGGKKILVQVTTPSKAAEHTPKPYHFPTQEPSLGACDNGHVGIEDDVCTAVGCNGAPFR